MKKLFLVAIIAMFSFTMNAQTEKGNWVIGGTTTMSFGHTTSTAEFDGVESDDDLKTTTINITPSVGFFVIDNLSVGFDLGFNSNKSKINENENKVSSFSVIPNAAYYFNASDKFKPYVGLGAGYIATSRGDDDSDKSSGLAIRGKGGLAYFITESIAVNFAVEYLNTSQENKENSDLKIKNSGIGAGLGISFFL